MFILSSSRHLAFSIISCRFRSSSSNESFLLNTKTTQWDLVLSQQIIETLQEKHELGSPPHCSPSKEMPNPEPSPPWVAILSNILGGFIQISKTFSEGFHTLIQQPLEWLYWNIQYKIFQLFAEKLKRTEDCYPRDCWHLWSTHWRCLEIKGHCPWVYHFRTKLEARCLRIQLNLRK